MSRYRPPSTTLYVRNITGRVKYDDMKHLFTKYGRINDISIPLDYNTGLPKGFCFVEYDDQRDAEEAQYRMHKQRLFGKEIEVEFAKGPRKTPGEMRIRDSDSYRRDGGSRYRDDGGSRRRRSRTRSRSRSPPSYSPPRRDRAENSRRGASPHARRPVEKSRVVVSKSRNAPSYSRSRSRSRSRSTSRPRTPSPVIQKKTSATKAFSRDQESQSPVRERSRSRSKNTKKHRVRSTSSESPKPMGQMSRSVSRD